MRTDNRVQRLLVIEELEPRIAPARIFVDWAASGAGTGVDWDNACNDLQMALDLADWGDEIWVADGTYVPGSGRTDTFQLLPGVALYGGFLGAEPGGYETELSPRDWRMNVAVLSGDVEGDDDGFINNGENVFHVVTGAHDAVLDGFTISGGNADDIAFPGNYGGGMFNYEIEGLSVTNCAFSGNWALYGGGGMFNHESPELSVTNCTFSGNQAQTGGGMHNESCSPTVTNCLFIENSAGNGGGMYNDMSPSPMVTNCTFSGNWAEYGGGGMTNSDSSPTVTNCILWGNESWEGWLELSNEQGAVPYISHSDIGECGGSGTAWNPDFGTDGGGNIDLDPQFINDSDPHGLDGILATLDDGLRLEDGSPCIDAGKSEGAPLQDILGTIRPRGAGVDMGAYESGATYYPHNRIGELCNGQVFLYDTDATSPEDVDVSCSDLLVKENKDGSVKSVSIVGNPTGLGVIVACSSDLPLSIMDKRNPRSVGALQPLSFVAYCSSARKICLESEVTGFGAEQMLVAEGLVENPDLDGDGAINDMTSIYGGGPVKAVKILGGLGADVVVEGADRGCAVGKLDVRYGDVLGDVVTLDGGLKCFNIRGGNFSGRLIVNGSLDKMNVKAMKEKDTGELMGGAVNGADLLLNGYVKALCANEIIDTLITAAGIGKVTVKGNLTQSLIHAGGSVDRNYQWTQGHGNIKTVTVQGDMVDSSITAGVWLGDNLQWDHSGIGDDMDTVCALPGSSVITKVCVKGTVTWTGRCGILAATDILKVQAKGNGWKLKSTDLPWPDSDYVANTGFLIDKQGSWV